MSRALEADGWTYSNLADCPDCGYQDVLEHVERGLLECLNCRRRASKDEWYSPDSGKTPDNQLTYREFLDHCLANEQEQQDRQYILGQVRRFYNSYRRLVDVLEPGDTVLSAGIGSGYLETALAETLDVEIFGADFEQSIRTNASFLDAYGIEFLPADLTRDEPFPEDISVDLVISAEVIEHIPQPPHEHVRKLAGVLNPGGTLYLTTPNLVRLRIIAKMLLGNSYLPPAGDFFAPVGYENEGVHRREYDRDEIETAVNDAGLTLLESGYDFNRSHRARDWQLWVLYPFEKLVPRFRPIMYFMARAPAVEQRLAASQKKAKEGSD